MLQLCWNLAAGSRNAEFDFQTVVLCVPWMIGQSKALQILLASAGHASGMSEMWTKQGQRNGSSWLLVSACCCKQRQPQYHPVTSCAFVLGDIVSSICLQCPWNAGFKVAGRWEPHNKEALHTAALIGHISHTLSLPCSKRRKAFHTAALPHKYRLSLQALLRVPG